MDITTMAIKSDGSKLRNLLITLILSILIAGFFLFAVIKITVTYHIYTKITFYLAISIVIAWLSIVVFIPFISRKLHIGKVIMTVLFSVTLVSGVIGSVVLGDTWFNQGALLFFVAGAILCLFGTFMLGKALVRQVRNDNGGHNN